jgi:hypothetical protein
VNKKATHAHLLLRETLYWHAQDKDVHVLDVIIAMIFIRRPVTGKDPRNLGDVSLADPRLGKHV